MFPKAHTKLFIATLFQLSVDDLASYPLWKLKQSQDDFHKPPTISHLLAPILNTGPSSCYYGGWRDHAMAQPVCLCPAEPSHLFKSTAPTIFTSLSYVNFFFFFCFLPDCSHQPTNKYAVFPSSLKKPLWTPVPSSAPTPFPLSFTRKLSGRYVSTHCFPFLSRHSTLNLSSQVWLQCSNWDCSQGHQSPPCY